MLPPNHNSVPKPRSSTSVTGYRKRKILNEDDYIKILSAIIERNYFPETNQLKKQLELLNNLENDNIPSHIRNKIIQNRYVTNNLDETTDMMPNVISSSSASSSSSSSALMQIDQNAMNYILIKSISHDHNPSSSSINVNDNNTYISSHSHGHGNGYEVVDISKLNIDHFFQQYTRYVCN